MTYEQLFHAICALIEPDRCVSIEVQTMRHSEAVAGSGVIETSTKWTCYAAATYEAKRCIHESGATPDEALDRFRCALERERAQQPEPGPLPDSATEPGVVAS